MPFLMFLAGCAELEMGKQTTIEQKEVDETANITQDEMNQMDAQLKTLLKSKFGNDIEKFFVTKKLTPKKAVSDVN